MSTVRRTVCDLRELPTMAALTAWATAHGAAVTYQGPDLQGHAVYAARRGPVTRVVTVPGPDPHPHPLTWQSPLETLPADAPPRAAGAAVRVPAARSGDPDPSGDPCAPARGLRAVWMAAVRAVSVL
ncbi:hypothetical protein [Nocardiopsis tropica]|uniref:Uncharacterized protein n=1 Tax=Nocardiopsis tropica TaxID=109330 RepID=A0ABU7KLV1_9ACTN|nr:hypothetical protein [Nocardiopsis umidischolae]MEE2050266.1 hypothetical protein [Nocardiopsis umidischolae]